MVMDKASAGVTAPTGEYIGSAGRHALRTVSFTPKIKPFSQMHSMQPWALTVVTTESQATGLPRLRAEPFPCPLSGPGFFSDPAVLSSQLMFAVAVPLALLDFSVTA